MQSKGAAGSSIVKLIAGTSAGGRSVRMGALGGLVIIILFWIRPAVLQAFWLNIRAMDKDSLAMVSILIALIALITTQVWQTRNMVRNSLQIRLQNRIEYQKLLFETDKLLIQNPILLALYNGNVSLLSTNDEEKRKQLIQVEAYASYHVNLFEVVYVFFRNNQDLLTTEEHQVYIAWMNWMDVLLDTSDVFCRVLKQGIREKSYNQWFVDHVMKQKSYEASLARALFPQLADKRWAAIDLNARAKIDFPGMSRKFEDNPLNDPEECAKWLDQIHKQLDVDFSYGGWMEDRSHLWRGHYQEQDGTFVHLGVDYNVPAGTEVYAPHRMTVHQLWIDQDQHGGWGGWVLVKDESANLYVIFGHLDPAQLPQAGVKLQVGDGVGVIGRADVNGGWYPHLHIQCVEGSLPLDTHGIDGYAKQAIPELMSRYPDPPTVL
jgi:murein DD-endopeptidase MepM/ murein hydrolase activator NlpD